MLQLELSYSDIVVARRTSGHCLEPFSAHNVTCYFPLHVASLTALPVVTLLSLSLIYSASKTYNTVIILYARIRTTFLVFKITVMLWHVVL